MRNNFLPEPEYFFKVTECLFFIYKFKINVLFFILYKLYGLKLQIIFLLLKKIANKYAYVLKMEKFRASFFFFFLRTQVKYLTFLTKKKLK